MTWLSLCFGVTGYSRSAAYLSALMAKLSGTARRMDFGFRRNDGRGRHPGESP